MSRPYFSRGNSREYEAINKDCKSCHAGKNEGENKLKQIFESKSISKGGIVKSFIFEINLPLEVFISSTQIISSQPINENCNQWWEYFYN